MNSIEFTSPFSETKVYACGICKTVVASTVTFGDGPNAADQARLVADDHCVPHRCKECGAGDIRPYRVSCDNCVAARDRLVEENRLAKAEKVKLSDYGEEYLYIDGLGRDGYVTLDSLEEELLEALGDGHELPRYAWACEPHGLGGLDAGHVIEHLFEDMHEGAIDDVDGLDELQAALDAWRGKQTVVSWMVVFSHAVDIGEIVDRLLTKRSGNGAIAEVGP